MVRAYTVVLLGFMYLPVFSFIVSSFNEGIYAGIRDFNLSLFWYMQVFERRDIGRALLNSLGLASAVAGTSTMLGLIARDALKVVPVQLRLVCLVLLIYPIFFPAIVQAASFSVLASLVGIDRSMFSVFAGQVTICLPLAILSLCASAGFLGKDLSTMDKNLPILTSLTITFVMSFNEWEMAYFLSSTGETLPLLIWTQMEYPETSRTLMSLSSLILFGLLAFLSLSATLGQTVVRLWRP